MLNDVMVSHEVLLYLYVHLSDRSRACRWDEVRTLPRTRGGILSRSDDWLRTQFFSPVERADIPESNNAASYVAAKPGGAQYIPVRCGNIPDVILDVSDTKMLRHIGNLRFNLRLRPLAGRSDAGQEWTRPLQFVPTAVDTRTPAMHMADNCTTHHYS